MRKVYRLSTLIFLGIVRFSSLSAEIKSNSPYDVTIVGFMKFADGLGRISIGIADALSKRLNVNFINTRKDHTSLDNLSPAVHAIAKNGDARPGKIAIFTDCLWDIARDHSAAVPETCDIKIAYSMLESSKLPPQWVTILNSRFDLIIVPDVYHVSTYQRSGVTTPIIVLPPICYLEEFLAHQRSISSEEFIFGNTSGLWIHKNQDVLIEAFAKAFSNAPRVKLLLNARGCDPVLCERIRKKIETVNANNIELQVKNLSWKNYIDYMASLNVFISLSKGEGFAFGPRESLSLGIPVIISDNTAHRTLCNTPFVYSVPAPIREPAYYPIFAKDCGFFFNCSVDDAIKAMLAVYHNYELYRKKALMGRHWVKRYLMKNLYKKYLNVVRPRQLILGEKNEVTDRYLMVNSVALYRKYKALEPDSNMIKRPKKRGVKKRITWRFKNLLAPLVTNFI